MITILHYDALHNPTQPGRKGAAISLAQAQGYLEQHTYDVFEESELLAVSLKLCRKIFSSFLHYCINCDIQI